MYKRSVKLTTANVIIFILNGFILNGFLNAKLLYKALAEDLMKANRIIIIGSIILCHTGEYGWYYEMTSHEATSHEDILTTYSTVRQRIGLLWRIHCIIFGDCIQSRIAKFAWSRGE